MDEFLAALGSQAMRYAIRSGIAITSSYAINQCSRLLNSIGNPELHTQLKAQQELLEGKLRVAITDERQTAHQSNLGLRAQLILTIDRSYPQRLTSLSSSEPPSQPKARDGSNLTSRV